MFPGIKVNSGMDNRFLYSMHYFIVKNNIGVDSKTNA
jgi:hypothetical protein